jgi:hypothetical protein
MPSQNSISPIPADTAHTAKAIYGGSNIYLSIGDQLAALLEDIHLNNNDQMKAPSRLGKPPLALVTFFQYQEKLSDRQAAEATSRRIDWIYALHLSMSYPGLNPIALCEFRQGLLSQPDRQQELQRFLERLKDGGYTQEDQEQPPAALRVLTEVCVRTRLDRAMTSMRHTLQALATRHPEWLLRISQPHWYGRYDMLNRRQPDLTQGMEQQQALTEATGADIAFLLGAITQADKPELASINEVQQLYQVWREQFDPICLEGVKLLPYCYFCGTNKQI